MRGFVFLLAVAVVVSFLSSSGPAHAALAASPPKTAAPAPPDPPAPGAAAPAPASPVGGYQAPGGAYAPQGGYPPAPAYEGYPAYPPGPYGYDPQRFMMYEHQKKNFIISLVLEFLVPGLGSIYAGHPIGAAITWGLTVGGFVLAFMWIADVNDRFNDDLNNGTSSSHDPNFGLMFGAMGLILAGRVYGLYDAYASTRDYNSELATRLGLPPGFALGVTPIKSGHQLAWGPSLSLRF